MKALALAVALLTAAPSLAQDNNADKLRAPAPTASQPAAATTETEATQKSEMAPEGADAAKFRSPPPGRPMPNYPGYEPGSGPNYPYPPNHTGTLVVLSREELTERLERMEELLEYLDERADRNTRTRLRRAQETLNTLMRQVSEAPLLATVMPRPQPPPPPREPVIRPMSQNAFGKLDDAIARENFNDDKLRVLYAGIHNNNFLCSQVAALMERFNFTQDKLNALRALKPRIIDPENHFILSNSFKFSSDKKRAQEILSQR
ncbi:DUF4476 domain-containing protein [Myxococcus landrumensis]|uniref:DUF4476 domain-containing protein n=1 Tax=Myxococcus landrumensis TaxID=2813577 RepID=A0ABX7N881_9BACT|nr:DUF4476 domain-containing protein [Myxococcus landrumus]QSQ13759.1 DUF4476 domain-containing protein [Myxococcus landrumus]